MIMDIVIPTYKRFEKLKRCLDSIPDNEIENVCKVCAKEYEIVKDSSSFRMCVG